MNHHYYEYKEALKSVPQPSLFLDLNAFYKNLTWVISNSGNKKIRVATKSIRSQEVLKRIFAANTCFQGLMTYTLEESLWLRTQGFDDILMGYPTTDQFSLEELAKKPQGIVLMVDRIEHLDMLEAIAKKHHSKFEICVDLDLSMDLPGVRFGVYRSAIHQEKHLRTFLKHLSKCHHLSLVGAMGYEAQIAGVMDEKSSVMKVLKTLSLTQLKLRRQKMIDIILNEGLTLRIINGGGTGSLKHTTTENCVNEVTIGSAFFAPVLFDHYQDFKLTPALFFTSSVVRQPEKDIFTILGGGLIASGATDEIKQPQPYLPLGLSLLKNEGAGEVQTPLKYTGDIPLKIGDLIILRHAKAGEVCERFNQIHFVDGKKIVDSFPTYRGEGKSFL